MSSSICIVPSIPFNKAKMLSAMRQKEIFSIRGLHNAHDFNRNYVSMCSYFREEQMPINILEEVCRFLEVNVKDVTDNQYEEAKNGMITRTHPPALIECYPANVLAAALGLDKDDPESNVVLAGFNLRPMYELDFLTERERRVISYRFYDRMTLDEVGQVFNVGKERIRQVEAKALRKIRGRKAKMMVYSKDDVYDNVKKALNEIKAVIGGEEAKPSPVSAGIETLDFSVRAYNCLYRSGITTIQELIAFDKNQKDEHEKGHYNRTWLGIRNMGRNTLKEVHDKVLDRIGYEINVNIL